MDNEPRLGLVIAGAAACLGQEYALLEALFRECHPTRHPVLAPPAVIAGTSSGALLAVCLNAILDGNSTFTWKSMVDDSDPDRPTGILATLRNRKIYSLDPCALFHGYLLGTRNFERLLRDIVNEQMGIQEFGQLRTPTWISVVERSTGALHRLSSVQHGDLDLVEILLASTAMPVALPPRAITGYRDGALFVDGGTGSDGIPTLSLEHERCDQIYLVTSQRHLANVPVEGTDAKLSATQLLRSIKQGLGGLFDRIPMVQSAHCLDYLMQAAFSMEIQQAPELADEAWLYMPALDRSYNAFNFSRELEQYRATRSWAEHAPPQRLHKADFSDSPP